MGKLQRVIFLLAFLIVSQAQAPIPISVNEVHEIHLQPNETAQYQVTVEYELNSDVKMYVEAQPILNDPYERPDLSIESDDKYVQKCYQEKDEFVEICSVPNVYLKKGRIFIIRVSCAVKCDLQLEAYYNNMLYFQIGDSGKIHASENIDFAQPIQIYIPEGLNFTQIYITVRIMNPDVVDEGLQLYVNWGPLEEVQVPTSQNYTMEGRNAIGYAIGVFLSASEVNVGQYIKAFVLMGENMTVSIETGFQNENTKKIYLFRPIQDFVAAGEQKEFILDLSGGSEKLVKNYSIDILIVIYSGNSQILLSFDPSFPSDKIISNFDISSVTNYLLTPELRKEKGYEGMVYVRFTGSQGTNFYLSARTNRKQFVFIGPQLTELVEIGGDTVQNFIYEDLTYELNVQSYINDYRAIGEIIDGELMLKVRRCKELEENISMKCFIFDKPKLESKAVEQSFSTIQTKVVEFKNRYEIYWSYNISNCYSSTYQGNKYYKCAFQLVATSKSSNNSTYAGITLEKMTAKKIMQEGVTVRGILLTGNYNYYSFTLAKTWNIKELQFFLTVITGDVLLIWSKTEKYPNLQHIEAKKAFTNWTQSIILNKGNIYSGTYYLSVYALEVSEYSISLAIQRSERQTVNITEIKLEPGSTHFYTLNKGKKIMYFSFFPHKQIHASVEVTALKGYVSLELSQRKGKNVHKVKCGESKCEFETDAESEYLVKVEGQEKKVQKFVISLLEGNQCQLYILNYPLYLNVNSESQPCYQFRVPEKGGLEISTSVNEFMIEHFMKIKAEFPSQTVSIEKSEKMFDEDALKILCKQAKKNQFCYLKLHVTAKRQINMKIAVSSSDANTILFSGIGHKVITEHISRQNAKKFSYNVEDKNQSITFFLTSKTFSMYRMVAKVVSISEYKLKEKYPGMMEEGENIFMVDSNIESELTVLTLNIKSMECDNCVILLAVYGYFADEAYIFTVEVIERERQLEKGKSAVGFLNKGQIHDYQITKQKGKKAVVVVSELTTSKCVKTYIKESKSMISFEEVYAFKGEEGSSTVIVESTEDQCTYRIQYVDSDIPLLQLIATLPYKVRLSQNKTKFYYYYHNKDVSFRVVEMIESGSAEIGIVPRIQNLEDMFSADLSSFPFYKGSQVNSLQVSNTSSKFCYQCYYLIGVKGSPQVVEEMVLVSKDTPITLIDSLSLKDRVKKDVENRYVYYSYTSFNLTITVLSGEVVVEVLDHHNKVRVNETIKATKQWQVLEVDEKESNFLSENSKYLVKLRGVKDTKYLIRTHSKRINYRITEGQPHFISLQKKSQVVQFKNTVRSKFINILIEDIKYNIQKPSENSQLKFKVEVDGRDEDDEELIENVTRSEGSYNLQIKSMKGNYYLTITSSKQTIVNILIAQQKLTHLLAGSTNLLSNPAIFEIFSASDPVLIEIFNCKGEVTVMGSSNYSNIVEGKEEDESLQHFYFGGHSVINSQSFYDQYFIRTINSGKDEVMYLLTYSTYPEGQMPYFDYSLMRTEIKYRNRNDFVEFEIHPVTKKQSSIPMINVTYWLYMVVEDEKNNEVMSCGMGNAYKEKLTRNQTEGGTIKWKIQKNQVKEMFGPDAEAFEIGAESIVHLEHGEKGQVSELSFIYDKIHMQINEQTPFIQFQDIKLIALFVILPFFVGSLLLFFAVRFCLRKFRAQTTSLIEEEEAGNASEEQFQKGVNEEMKK